MNFIVTDGHFLAKSTLYQILVGGPILLGMVVMVVAFIVDISTSTKLKLAGRAISGETVFGLGLAMMVASLVFMLVDGVVLPTISAHL